MSQRAQHIATWETARTWIFFLISCKLLLNSQHKQARLGCVVPIHVVRNPDFTCRTGASGSPYYSVTKRSGIWMFMMIGTTTGMTSGNIHILSSVYGKAVSLWWFRERFTLLPILLGISLWETIFNKVSRDSRAASTYIWWHGSGSWVEISVRECINFNSHSIKQCFSARNVYVLD